MTPRPETATSLTVDKLLRADDVAPIFSSWSLNGTGPDGKPLEQTGPTSDVVRRQADGTWRIVIDTERQLLALPLADPTHVG